MIKSFKDKNAKLIWAREYCKTIPTDIHRTAYKKLRYIDAAEAVDDLRSPPGNCLKKLGGDRVEQYSIRINDQWRICFEWLDGHAYSVEIVDYH